LELYAGIMHERFRDRVALDWQIDRTVLDIPVPALLLQPLLENVFKHGVERTVKTRLPSSSTPTLPCTVASAPGSAISTPTWEHGLRSQPHRCRICVRPTHNSCWPHRSEEHTSELQSLAYLVCRLLL